MPKTKRGAVDRAVKWLHQHRFLDLHGIQNWSGGGWGGSWWPGAILESFTGAWQQNTVAAPTATLMSYSAVFACVTGISSDIAKMRIKLVRNDDGIWEEITQNQPWLSVLRDPNHYQDHMQFIESWLLSKLMYGNTYVLKHRDNRNVVNALYVLHPGLIKPLVAEDSSVFYELTRDDLSGVDNDKLEELVRRYGRVAIPSSEMIHDRMNTFWHPLVGISPLYACGQSATMGTNIFTNSATFFGNSSIPGGIVTVPGEISNETATTLKTTWETNFGGTNRGRVAILGDGMKFDAVRMTADESQTEELANLAVDDVARAFRYPRWKLGGPTPPYTKPDQAQTMYYTDCLAPYILKIEKCLEKGLELPLGLGTEFDLETLLWMDTAALFEAINAGKNFFTPNEQRRMAGKKPVPVGGDTIYKQEQDHSIEAIAKRDAKEEFEPANTGPKPTAQMAATTETPRQIEPSQEEVAEMTRKFEEQFRRDLIHA